MEGSGRRWEIMDAQPRGGDGKNEYNKSKKKEKQRTGYD